MPVQIGAKVHNFSDPTGLLSDCHRRVEMFLGMLEAAANKMENPATEETTRLLESALQYFSQAGPKHTADEEESLFPRMRQIPNPEILSALGKLDELEEEHRLAAPWHAEVERLGRKYLASRLTSTEVEQFRQAVTSLSTMYKQHIRIEDELIFPLAARMLSEADKVAIAREMANRRDLVLTKLRHE